MRNAVGTAILRHQAGIGLQHRVHRRALGERPALAEARDRDIEDPRLARRDLLIVEAEAMDDLGAEALEEDVGALQQPPHDLLAGVGLEVDGETALSQIADDREGRMAGVADAQRARPVAVAQALDLDHVGAVLGEQHGAVRSGDPLAEIDDLEAREGRIVAHGSPYIFTSSLPKFSPRSRPMKARGALSMP